MVAKLYSVIGSGTVNMPVAMQRFRQFPAGYLPTDRLRSAPGAAVGMRLLSCRNRSSGPRCNLGQPLSHWSPADVPSNAEPIQYEICPLPHTDLWQDADIVAKDWISAEETRVLTERCV